MKTLYRHISSAAVAVALVAASHALAAGETTQVPAVADDYARVAADRAARIVPGLALSDMAQAERVTRIVADQYVRLHAIHEARDARLAALKGANPSDPAAAKKLIMDEAAARLYPLHAEYLARLAVELTPAQVDQVKDGMTYGVLPNTWRAYQEMLPDLTDEQRRQIHAWLIEARELAMDGSTSEEKHGWFGKYKGRITNYLTAAGYDLKAAEKVWLDGKKK